MENDCKLTAELFIDSTCFQLSSGSITFENPFRDGGKLSRDAEDIVIAVKTGKLSVGSRHEENDDSFSSKETSIHEPHSVPSSLVKPCDRKNAVIENIPKKEPKEVASQDVVKEKIKNQKCCVLS